jgi:hypothetical protein
MTTAALALLNQLTSLERSTPNSFVPRGPPCRHHYSLHPGGGGGLATKGDFEKKATIRRSG